MSNKYNIVDGKITNDLPVDPYHHTKEGKKINIHELTNEHLKNLYYYRLNKSKEHYAKINSGNKDRLDTWRNFLKLRDELLQIEMFNRGLLDENYLLSSPSYMINN